LEKQELQWFFLGADYILVNRNNRNNRKNSQFGGKKAVDF
jgi:hypothetical protein